MAKQWWRRWWWGVVLVAIFAAVAGFAAFTFVAAFMDARAQHELESAEDALYDGRYSDAVREASNAVNLAVEDPVRVRAHLVRATAQFELGRFREAADDATTAIALAAGSLSSTVAVCYAVRAQAHVELGSFDGAIADAATAIALMRDDSSVAAYVAARAYLARADAHLRSGADEDIVRADLERGVRYAAELPTLEPRSLRQRVGRANASLRGLDD